MKGYTIKKPFALILLVLILSNDLSVFGQAAKRDAVKPKSICKRFPGGQKLL